MSAFFTDTTPQALSEAVEANMFAATPLIFGAASEAIIEDTPERLLYSMGLPFAPLNGVCRSQFDPADAAEQVRETMAFFRERNFPMMWWVGPSCRPAELGNLLEAEGLRWTVTTPGMAIELASLSDRPSPADGTQILEARDDAGVAQWAEACIRGFQMPDLCIEPLKAVAYRSGFGEDSPLRNFYLLESGSPVAAASLCMAAGIAGLYCVSTAPEARRKGYASALVLEALLAGRQQGYKIGILQSSTMGRPVYERMGFREVCAFEIYRWDGEEKQAAEKAELSSATVI